MKKEKQNRKPRLNALVKYATCLDERVGPFGKKAVLVYLGEIPNMPGHCVVADVKTGRIHAGFHSDRFTEILEDET